MAEVPAPETPTQRLFKPEDLPGANVYMPAIRTFLCGLDPAIEISESNPYKVIDDELWFIRKRQRHGIRTSYLRSLVAKKINGRFFGNSSEIFGKKRYRSVGRTWVKQLEVQRRISQFIPMIPFELFKTLKLDVGALKIIDSGPEEDFDFGRKNKEGKVMLQHFTGAMVFSIGKQFYMFDVDRNEVDLKNFNCWMSRLPRAVTSIEDAYRSLKPKEVEDAERFLGKACERQGEWFFIPVQGNFEPDKTLTKASVGYGSNQKAVATLQSKGNRAHYVEEMCKEGFVRGTVTHGGYEHKDIELPGWCKAVPNSAVESFRITGMVD